MENFYFNLHQELLDTRLMRAFLSKYLRDNGYYCCDVFFAQVRFKPEAKPKCFDNSLGYNLIYETIAYRPNQGWSWEKLVKEYANVKQNSEPKNDLYSILNQIPGTNTIFTQMTGKYSNKNWENSWLSFDNKLEIIKVYFDVMSGQICFRDFANSVRNDEINYGFLDKKKTNEKRTFCKWLSRNGGDEYSFLTGKYEDSWYEECIYEPICFNIGAINFYKIEHEPYYEKQHQLLNGEKGLKQRLYDWDVQASSLLSPIEIVHYLYWHVYQKNGENEDYNIDNHLSLEMLLMSGDFAKGENDWLWHERFIQPSTEDCPNRAFFYTSNVLELLADVKMEFSMAFAALSKYFTKYIQATSMSLNQVRDTIKDIYWKIYRNRCYQIEEKWEHFFFLASQPKLREAGKLLLRLPKDEVPAYLFSDLYGLDGESDGLADAVNIACFRDKAEQKDENEEIKFLSEQNQKVNQISQNFEQKYREYLQSKKKILQIKQELKVMREKDELPSLAEITKMQKLLD